MATRYRTHITATYTDWLGNEYTGAFIIYWMRFKGGLMVGNVINLN
jgi:hypothetical protein